MIQELPVDIVNTVPVTVALVQGEAWSAFPKDLYVPSYALEIALESFTGPLDLLLYLIRKQNLDILDIPIVTITDQYIKYINLMQNLQLDLAAEYLAMAALLAEIKSRMLLPKPVTDESVKNDDPRADLARQLSEYEQFKRAAAELDAHPRLERDFFLATAALPSLSLIREPPAVTLPELLEALQQVLKQAELFQQHRIEKEPLSVKDRIIAIQKLLITEYFVPFSTLLTVNEGRMGVVVTFLAILELLKNGYIELEQQINYGVVLIRAKNLKV